MIPNAIKQTFDFWKELEHLSPEQRQIFFDLELSPIVLCNARNSSCLHLSRELVRQHYEYYEFDKFSSLRDSVTAITTDRYFARRHSRKLEPSQDIDCAFQLKLF